MDVELKDGEQYLVKIHGRWRLLAWDEYIGHFEGYISRVYVDKTIPLDLAIRAPELQAEKADMYKEIQKIIHLDDLSAIWDLAERIIEVQEATK